MPAPLPILLNPLPGNQPGPNDLANAYYSVYDVQRHRWRDSGRRALPVAGPDPQPAQMVKLFAAQEFESVTFTIAMDGARPTIPSPTDLEGDSNYTFIDFHFGGFLQIPLADGNVRYQVMGTYVYSLTRPTGLLNGFNLGLPPWNKYNSLPLEQIPGANFQNGLLNNTPIRPSTKRPPIQVPNYNPIR